MFCGMPSRLILMSWLLLRGNDLDDVVRKTISNWVLLFPTSIAQRYLEILWSGSVRMSFLLSIVLKFARVECWIDDFGSTNLLFLDHSKQLFMDVASQSKVNMNINTKYRFGFLSFLLILNKCLMLSYQWTMKGLSRIFHDFPKGPAGPARNAVLQGAPEGMHGEKKIPTDRFSFPTFFVFFMLILLFVFFRRHLPIFRRRQKKRMRPSTKLRWYADWLPPNGQTLGGSSALISSGLVAEKCGIILNF